MTVALIYPPACDPTAPYISVPLLTGVLRSRGIDVLPVDANVEAFDRLLQQAPLAAMARRVEQRLARLMRKPTLGHTEQLLCLRLCDALPDLAWVPDAIVDALAVLRDASGRRFYDPDQYEQAVLTVTAALRLVSAAHAPLELSFSAYRTPFGLLDEARIEVDARPSRNPFHVYFNDDLCSRLAAAGVILAGISLAFPGQIQPGFALAYAIKQRLPHVHLTVGGPAATQLMGRFDDDRIAAMCGPFDSVVLFEGERALPDLVLQVADGRTPPAVIHGPRTTDLTDLPAPDFDGFPLEKYFSPEPVLPYDPTRGCYWGRCAFCHYGLSRQGTVAYRQRPAETVAAHLEQLATRWDGRIFYFSQDTMAPAFAHQVARHLQDVDRDIRWGTDMRAESTLTRECCEALKAGGALSVALGIESAAPRLMRLIDKGLTLEAMTAAVTNLAAAGIAVEAMCFTDFPTETRKEAVATITWLKDLRAVVALFICGHFGLSHGSRVASDPAAYGLDEVWHLTGDHWRTGLFYLERREPKTAADRDAVDRAIDELSAAWWLHDYPWAGALSTAHTLLYYAHGGPDVFRRLAGIRRPVRRRAGIAPSFGSFDLDRMATAALDNEAAIWRHLIHERRSVSPALYARCAAGLPAFTPRGDDRTRRRRIRKTMCSETGVKLDAAANPGERHR